MLEIYKGVKFNTVFQERIIPQDNRIIKLKEWCERLARIGLSPKYNGSSGNLSFRTDDGFIITATNSDFSSLDIEDFVEVLGCDLDEKKVYVKGVKEPSSESILHNEIYSRRNDINAIFHCHDKLVLKLADKLGLKVTEKEQPYGSIALMWEVVKILNNCNYLVIRNHGILSFGATMKDAGNLILRKHFEALKLKFVF